MIEEKTVPPATKPEATYIVKKTRKMIAQIIWSAGLLAANLFERYCGSVIESFAAAENLRSLAATSIQLSVVPTARPMPIQTLPRPKAHICN